MGLRAAHRMREVPGCANDGAAALPKKLLAIPAPPCTLSLLPRGRPGRLSPWLQFLPHG